MFRYKHPRPMVCVDVALFCEWTADANGVLLIQRGRAPFEGWWALPGGFVEMDEALEAAAQRELQEETDVRVDHLIQVGAFGDPARDPRGRNISIVYTGFAATRIVPRAGDDAGDAAVFPLTDLPSLAFDHELIIESAINVLKSSKKWR